ncbi:MAG: agmatine deiminase family protein [Phycisphaerae bacterium]|nr:agmatine deiminase family protein [Phycisphaerae bacterium]
MRLRAIILGAAAGLLAGGAAIFVCSPWGQLPAFSPLPEDRGRMSRVVMHYHPRVGEAVASIYRQFLSAAGPNVEVVWVVNAQADLDDLQKRLGAAWPAGRSRAVLMGKEVSTWSKDRCLTLTAPSDERRTLLLAPARQLTWSPLRTNDQEAPHRQALDFADQFICRGLDADFDGGDFLITTRHAFASSLVLAKNPPSAGRFASADDVRKYLARELRCELTWLGDTPDDVPPHHIGMFLTVIGQIAFVGDVQLARRIAASQPDVEAALSVAGGEASAEFEGTLQSQLGRVAGQMRSLGYRVVRVPVLPSATTRAWFAYNNGIVETRDGQTIFYMPTFGAPSLDMIAAGVFQNAGCRVVPIDCSTIWPMGGSLHCLVNVVSRAQ